ncbi:thyroid transcription factor 1-associated protein 26-like [Saccostrea echinata]|uniref:thyroid transcription factor 1-associated protein 26-like n=1 Tax=Saccostrea echinata TaxID=191078 RepID=UPI002A802EB0|nr:thyroid transcription factor 1-associated protein 26-like [Saccostrea echinata]
MNNGKHVHGKFQKKGERGYKNFIGNKTEGQGFADKRKRKIQHEYRKLLKKEKKSEVESTKHVSVLDELSEEEETPPDVSKQKSTKKSIGTYSKAHHEYKQRKKEKERKKQEAKKNREAMDAAIEKYNKKKQSNYKLLCKRTSKGQPVMKHQIDYLLEKIKKQKAKS